MELGGAGGPLKLPLVGQPGGKFGEENLREVHQQLGEIDLGIDIVATACAGQAGEDRCRSATAFISDERRVFTIQYDAFHSSSLRDAGWVLVRCPRAFLFTPKKSILRLGEESSQYSYSGPPVVSLA